MQVRVNDDSHVETLERQTYGGNLAPRFTAHPKIDPATGEAEAASEDLEEMLEVLVFKQRHQHDVACCIEAPTKVSFSCSKRICCALQQNQNLSALETL